MSRITIAIAEETALKITKPLKNKIAEAELAFQEKVTELMDARIPKEIRAGIEKYPEWFSGRQTIELKNEGFNRRKVDLTRKVYFQDHWHSSVEVTKAESKILYKMDDEVEKAQEKYDRTYESIRQTLLNLRTYKRVSEELPDAYPLLPPVSTSTGIMVIPTAVKAAIACLISEDKECLKKI